VQAGPARITEIAGWLPAQPAPIGAAVTDRAVWSAMAARLPTATILAEADKLLSATPPSLTDDLYLTYSRTGNRTTFESALNQRRDRLTHFAWAEALDRRGRYLAALQAEIDAALGQKTWVLPAHDGSLVNFNGQAVEVDLGAAMLGWSLATVADWFGPELGADRLARVQFEIRRRVVDPYLNAVRRGPTGGFWWINSNSNWNAVCHAGVTGAALSTVADVRTRAEVVATVEANLAVFLTGFTDDGVCSEGIGYWSYGFGHYALLGEALNTATAGRLRLLAGDKTRRVTEFATAMELLPGLYPAFADNAANVRPAAWVAPLARRLLGGGTAPYAAGALGWTDVARDQLYIGALRAWTPSTGTVPSTSPTELRHWFADSQVLVARAASDFAAAIKGGHNDELHNHNDLGSFVVALGRSTPLVDPGSEVYTARTFSAQRYESNVLNSFGHGVPLVAGQLQREGRQYEARVLATEFTLDADRLVLDLRRAYPVAALRRLERTFTCRRGAAPGYVVRDEFEFDSAQAFGVALITFLPWRLRDAATIEIGTGAEAVRVRFSSEGGAVVLRSEIINENLSNGQKPTRLGLDFTAPVLRGSLTVSVQRATGALAETPAIPDEAPAGLANLSSRGQTMTGPGVLTAGLVVRGTGRKTVLLRAVGPTLAAIGVPDPLGDPRLVVFADGAELARNDNWGDLIGAVDAATAAAGAFPLGTGSRDAALVLDLAPGSYTAEVHSTDGSVGGAMLEAYDAGGAEARLVNLSTRGMVGAGGNVLIVGLVVQPGAPRWFLLRGIGPGLARLGLGGVLADPVLAVYQGSTLIAQNDDWAESYWREELAAAGGAVGAFPLDPADKDAALLLQLPPGVYTLHVAGKGAATGVAMGEVYELPLP
jgi:hypothetical protein